MSNASNLAGFSTATAGDNNLNAGIVTATQFHGDGTNITNVTSATATTAEGLTGTPDIDVRNVTGVAATFTGNVSIAGTLTYEDVTNVDSIGVITARSGVHFGTQAAGTLVVGDSDGIGIGTDNPSVLLHLMSSSPIIELQDSDSTGVAALQRIDATQSGGTTQWFIGQNSTTTSELWIQNITNSDIRFGTNNTERVRITSGGNVGIGTDNPTTELQINAASNEATISLFNAATKKAALQTQNNFGSILYSYESEPLIFSVSTGQDFSEKLRIDSSGSIQAIQGTTVGIATLGAESSLSASNQEVCFNGTLPASNGNHEKWVIQSNTLSRADDNNAQEARLNFISRRRSGSDSTFVTLKQNGFVGIGTTIPAKALEVVSDTTPQFQVGMSNNSARSSLMHNGTNLYLDTTSGDQVFRTNSTTERMRIDSEGKTTIQGKGSSNNPFEIFTLQNTETSSSAQSIQINLETNRNNQQGFSRIRSIASDNSGTSVLQLNSSEYRFKNQADTSTFATIDSSGTLLVGTTSASSTATTLLLQGSPDGSSGPSYLRLATGTATPGSTSTISQISFTDSGHSTAASIIAFRDGGTWTSGSSQPTKLVFSTTADSASSPTERMRIDSSGSLNTWGALNGMFAHTIGGSSSSYVFFRGYHSATAGSSGSGTFSFQVNTNGNVANTNNSYGALSDIKLKENIVDAHSQWDDLKALRVRNYNLKEETGHQTFTQLGVIAQEVELVSPGLVTESPDLDAEGNDLGTTTKSVNYSVLYMKAVKALQEAIGRIETLEAEVAALKAG